MKTYDAIVTRDGKWWMIEIPDLDGLTQARRLAEVEDMAREFIAVSTRVPQDEIALNVIHLYVSGEDFAPVKAELIEARAVAEAADQKASALARKIAADLVGDGVPLRDVGAVVGLSYQRVDQLVKS